MAIFFAGEVIVESGDVLSGLTAGVIYVTSGGTVINTQVLDRGYLEVDSGAVAIGTFNDWGLVEVYGGVVSGTQAVAGTINLVAFGEAIGTTLSGTASQVVRDGSVAIATTVSTWGSEVVSATGVASGTTVSSGGWEIVSAGGLTSGTTVRAGGTERVWDGGAAVGTTVLSGGTLELFGGAIASAATIASGATLMIGSQFLPNGNLAAYTLNGYTVSAGVTLDVEGGNAVGATVDSGGEVVVGRGTANGTTIGSGGEGVVSGGTVGRAAGPPRRPSLVGRRAG